MNALKAEKQIRRMPNKAVQRTVAGRFAQRQVQRHGRLAPVADLGVSCKRAGLQDVEFLGQTSVSTSPKTDGAAFRARKPPQR